MVAVYPNPAIDYITIQSNIESANNTVQLFDANGTLIAEKRNSSSNEKIALDKLSAGTYIIKDITEQGTSIKKFVKIN